jgi:hypothetical protein
MESILVVSSLGVVGGATGFVNSESDTSITLTYSPTEGNFVHIAVVTDSGNPASIACQDNNGNSLPLIQYVNVRSNAHGMAQFGGRAISGATSYIISWTGGGSEAGAALEEYFGATGAVVATSANNGAGSSWSNSLSVSIPGNRIVSAFGSVTLGSLSTSVTVGTTRQTSDNSSTYNQAVLIDNTNTSGNTVAGTLASGGTILGWGVGSFELQASSALVLNVG